GVRIFANVEISYPPLTRAARGLSQRERRNARPRLERVRAYDPQSSWNLREQSVIAVDCPSSPRSKDERPPAIRGQIACECQCAVGPRASRGREMVRDHEHPPAWHHGVVDPTGSRFGAPWRPATA